MHQVRQSTVATQFDHLGVDHQHPDFIGTAAHQDGTDDRVETNTFTSTGSSGDQQVWHLGQIDHHWIARDVFAQEHRDIHLGHPRIGLFHHVTQTDDLSFFVGDFDANRVFTWNRRDNPHAWDAQCDRQVIG